MKSVVRAFFKTVRAVLGPVLLLKERLFKPKGVVRELSAQTVVNLQCQNLALYQFKTCPFCMKVRQEMRRLSLPIEHRDAQHDTAHRTALLHGGGAIKVPCLRISEGSGKTQWLYDSAAIVAYLRARFGAGTSPK
jgi:glutaredoxin